MDRHVIQVELRTGATQTLTWLDAALKPKPGTVLFCKDDPRAISGMLPMLFLIR